MAEHVRQDHGRDSAIRKRLALEKLPGPTHVAPTGCRSRRGQPILGSAKQTALDHAPLPLTHRITPSTAGVRPTTYTREKCAARDFLVQRALIIRKWEARSPSNLGIPKDEPTVQEGVVPSVEVP